MGYLARFSALVTAFWLTAEVLALAAPAPWRARRRRSEDGLRPGLHELKDLRGWPAEPASPEPIDPAKFRQALWGLCEGMVTRRAAEHLADQVRGAANEAQVDAFLLGALVYRASRCTFMSKHSPSIPHPYSGPNGSSQRRQRWRTRWRCRTRSCVSSTNAAPAGAPTWRPDEQPQPSK